MNIGSPNVTMPFSFLFVHLFWKILPNFGSGIWLLCLFIEWHLLLSFVSRETKNSNTENILCTYELKI